MKVWGNANVRIFVGSIVGAGIGFWYQDKMEREVKVCTLFLRAESAPTACPALHCALDLWEGGLPRGGD